MTLALLGLLLAAPLNLATDYPIGMYSSDSPQAIALAAECGVDFVHTYAGGNDLERDRAYLDAAAAAGVRVMYNLNGRRLLAMDDGLAEMTRFVEALKDHPALGFWYLYDEPDGSYTPEQLAPYYARLKELTPDLPVGLCQAWTANWWRYQEQLDLLMIDIYPVQHRPFPDNPLQHMTNFTHGALRLGKPVIPINQCINWRVFAGDAETYRGSPTAELRYPNPAELRYLAFSGLAQGARGLFWYSQTRSQQVDPAWFGEVFGPVNREFADFVHTVDAGRGTTCLPRDREDPAIVACWQRDNGTWLAVVNATATPQAFDLDLTPLGLAGTLTPWGTTRAAEATLTAGRLTVAAEPWEVFLWQVTPAG